MYSIHCFVRCFFDSYFWKNSFLQGNNIKEILKVKSIIFCTLVKVVFQNQVKIIPVWNLCGQAEHRYTK